MLKNSFFLVLTLFLASCGMGVRPGAPPLTIGSASSSPNADGTVTVTITGSGFVDGMTVRVDGNACSNVHLVSSTQLTCVLPNGNIALVNIVITTPGGGSSGVPNPIVSTTAASANQDTVDIHTWANLNFALTNDGNTCSFSGSSHETSPNLYLMGYFSNGTYSLPAGAAIKGVTASCYGRGNGGSTQVLSGNAYLLKNGAKVGSGVPQTGSTKFLPASLGVTETLGGATNLWGASLTPADILSSGFGFVIRIDSTSSNPDLEIDYCTMAVYWSQ